MSKRIKDVQTFIGLAGYYRKFIDQFSKIAKTLTQLTKKGIKFEWGDEHQAFEMLKENLSSAHLLAYPNFTKEFIVTTDASDYAELCCRTVGQDNSLSRTRVELNIAEQNYNITEKELLAIV